MGRNAKVVFFDLGETLVTQNIEDSLVTRRALEELSRILPKRVSGAKLYTIYQRGFKDNHAIRSRHHVERHRVQLALDLVVPAPDEPLGRVDRPLRVQDRLPPGELPDQAFTGVGERHHGRRCPRSLGVGNHLRFAAFPYGDHLVGRAEVDTYCLGHELLLPAGSVGPGLLSG